MNLNRYACGLVILILMLLPVLSCFGSEDYLIRKPFIINDMIKSRINCMLQDDEGNIWIGTADGLYRYTGTDAVRYSKHRAVPESLPDNFITSLYEDEKGDLLIGTQKNGICRYDRRKDSFLRYDGDSPFAIINGKHVSAIISDMHGNIWIGTMGDGLYRISGDKFEFFNGGEGNLDFITCLAADSRGNLWIGTSGNGIYIYVTGESKVIGIDKWYTLDFSGKHVNTIFKDASGVMWVGGSREGLTGFDENGSVVSFVYGPAGESGPLNSDCVSCVYSDTKGLYWIGTFGGGMNILDSNFRRLGILDMNGEKNMESGNITCVLKSKDGLLWYATDIGELFCLECNTGSFGFGRFDEKTNDNPFTSESNNITCVYAGSGNMTYVGNFKGELGIMELDGTMRMIGRISDNAIKSICEGENGRMWIGTMGGGLFWYDKNTGEKKVYGKEAGFESEYIFAVCVLKKGTVCVGTSEGLYLMERKENEFEIRRADDKLYVKGNPLSYGITCVLEDLKGNLWIGTDRGIDVVNLCNMADNGKFMFVPGALEPFGSGYVNSLCMDIYGRVWVCSAAGLGMYVPEIMDFKVFTTEEGLPGNDIQNAVCDGDGKMWVTTNGSLCKFEPDSACVKEMFIEGGDVYFYFNCAGFTPDGTVFFGTTRGLMYFNTDEVASRTVMPRTYVDSIEISGGRGEEKRVYHDMSGLNEKPITLGTEDFMFEITFNAVEFRDPAEITFSYKLLPFHDNWVFAGNRNYVSFAGMEPGNYVFQVRNSDSEGKWSTEYESVGIIILPPFWRKPEFILAVFFAAGLAFFLAYLKQKSNKRKLEKLVMEKTIQLAQTNEKLKIQSVTDGLTGVYNHKFLMNQLRNEIMISSKKSRKLSIIMMDIDHFKGINDEYGHQFGDVVLKDVAEIMANSVRESDFVGRYGGEEFMVILTDTDSDGACLIAERIRQKVSTLVKKHGVAVTVSGGAASYSGESMEDFINIADARMYTAKRQGRNNVVGNPL